MKFIYVVIGSAEDFFLEQALLSMFSLKMHNTKAEIMLLTDIDTKKACLNGNSLLKALSDDIVTVDVPQNFNKEERNRFIKTSVPQYVSGDFLYLDNDTIVTCNLDDLENLEGDINAVADRHSYDIFPKQLSRYIEITGKKVDLRFGYFNGGVLFVRDNPNSRQFYSDWHINWLMDRERYKYIKDQPSLMIANAKDVIKKMPDAYNCQILTEIGLEMIDKAKIIHYFSSYFDNIDFPLKNPLLLKLVRQKGITQEVECILRNPGLFVLKGFHWVDSVEYYSFNQPMSILGRKLAKDFPWTNKIVRWIYKLGGYTI